jgi:CheY-like chemotaxis protein/nitrogen-specific signal transduction histidine kinase
LEQLNDKLEDRVQRRTAQLEKANEELIAARDEARGLTRAKDAFLATVSHELRNPLNQVTGFCQLLELTELDEEQRADLKKILTASSHLLTLINDILDYQKIIMGGISLEPAEFDVTQLLGEIKDAMAFHARDNKNQLVFESPGEVGTLYADKQRVRQVLINLVGNACKFTKAGTVTVTALRNADDKNQWVELSVRDTGRGMKPEELAGLFTPFSKLAARDGNQAGTGLGLVISKGLCELMGGDVGVTSQFGAGSTFTVRFPATPADRLPKAAPVQPDGERADDAQPPVADVNVVKAAEDLARAVEDAAGEGTSAAVSSDRTVLVIDDDDGAREMTSRFLSDQGFHVVTAADGLEGLRLAKTIRPAVITLDALMPGLDGWAVLAALKTDSETRSIPVVMVTITEGDFRSKSLGAEEFLQKPVDWDDLSRRLAQYTGDKRERTVLVVDDDPSAREIIRRGLERDHWTVLEAEHGAAALELLAHEHPAAIILDLDMPVMNGFEFIHQYSQLAEWLSVPVIVLTATDPTPAERERLSGQVVRVLRKGDYSPQELLREIHRRVDRHIQERETAGIG